MAYTLEELEERLGPPEDFILTVDNRRYLSLWALAIGLPAIEVYSKSNVELTNLYHERGKQSSEPNEMQRLAAEIFFRTVQNMKGGFNADLCRSIVREEMATLPARRLEVVQPHATVMLDGPMHYATEQIIRIASLNQPIMQVGPTGCGKTTIAKHVATALQLPFYITSTINDTHELTGFIDGHGMYHRTPFRDAYEFGGLWVADEIDAWDASAFLAANSALANGYSVFPDNPRPVTRHPAFRIIATANTFGRGADRVYVGRNELDAATLDRFATINVDYDLTLEQMFANGNMQWLEHVWQIRKAVMDCKIRHVVSSRAIIMGSAALSAGIDWKSCEEIYIFKGMSENDREKINDN